jgi:hypothetical protein
MGCDLVAFGDQDRHLVAHLGIAGVDGGPHLPQRGLAVAVAHMRQDIDRGVGEEIDIVGATRQRAFDVSGIEDLEKVQHALTVKIRRHPVLRRRSTRLDGYRLHCGRNGFGINRPKEARRLTRSARRWFPQPKGVVCENTRFLPARRPR